MSPGQIINVQTHIRAFDEEQVSYLVDGPILVLCTNKYDVTFLSGERVLYTSHQELAVELELNVT